MTGETTVTAAPQGAQARSERYKWLALGNTTMGVFMSALDGSIVIIALPAIFNGIHLDPLAAGNVAYLLWMIMGYRLVQAVLVVTLGRLGDIFGRVRMYNIGFTVFAAASLLLSFDPSVGRAGALWLIGWRCLQAVGGSMLTANSAAILTDAFPAAQRGLALGVNQIAAIAGQFIGLVAGGLLAVLDWRAVFWVNVPVGVVGAVWAYTMLRDTGERHRARIDWWGNGTFAVGLAAVLVAVTDGIQPSAGHTMSWTTPGVLVPLVGGLVLLCAFVVIERRVPDPMFDPSLFRNRAFAAGNIAGFIGSVGRGGLQFVLIIWLQGIWLPLHGYDYSRTPLWAGIYLLPMTGAFLVSGPVSGWLSDRWGSRGLSTTGMLLFGASFLGLLALPVDFPYWAFALMITLNGLGVGIFSSPNSSAIMGSVPARHRGAASGMRSTFQNSGTALSIGAFFSLMIAGLASSLPATLHRGLTRNGVSDTAAQHIAGLPPVSSLFSAILGENPIKHLLSSQHALAGLTASQQATLTSRSYFPHLIAGPFHDGLVIVFSAAAALALLAAIASALRGSGAPAASRPTRARPSQAHRAETS